MFLFNHRSKTHRGLKAAVPAGRLAGGRAYGYPKVIRNDGAGRVVNGVLEVDLGQALILNRNFAEFAESKSNIQIATRLDLDGIPGARGGEWDANTIRGDPKKLVGILNNPLYRGRLAWGHREWRNNPDSDRRERRHRLQDSSEWIEVDVPDLRIVDDSLAVVVAAAFARVRRSDGQGGTGSQKRARHLLSGLIKCSGCGANHTLVRKDYYRRARNRKRGTAMRPAPCGCPPSRTSRPSACRPGC